MQLSTPETVRGGLLFQSRLQIDASRTIDHLRVVLDDGWFEGTQISSVEPQPTAESSRDGRVVFSYGLLRAGDRLVVWIQSVLLRNLRRQRLTVDELEAEARQQQIESLDRVRYAVLETSGKISFLSAQS